MEVLSNSQQAVRRTCFPSAIATSPGHRTCSFHVVAIAATENGPAWRHILAPIWLLSFNMSWKNRDLFPCSWIVGMPHARDQTCANVYNEEISSSCWCYSSIHIEFQPSRCWSMSVKPDKTPPPPYLWPTMPTLGIAEVLAAEMPPPGALRAAPPPVSSLQPGRAPEPMTNLELAPQSPAPPHSVRPRPSRRPPTPTLAPMLALALEPPTPPLAMLSECTATPREP